MWKFVIWFIYIISRRFKVELYSKGLNFTNGISIFNNKFVYHKILTILDITDMQNTGTQKIF